MLAGGSGEYEPVVAVSSDLPAVSPLLAALERSRGILAALKALTTCDVEGPRANMPAAGVPLPVRAIRTKAKESKGVPRASSPSAAGDDQVTPIWRPAVAVAGFRQQQLPEQRRPLAQRRTVDSSKGGSAPSAQALGRIAAARAHRAAGAWSSADVRARVTSVRVASQQMSSELLGKEERRTGKGGDAPEVISPTVSPETPVYEPVLINPTAHPRHSAAVAGTSQAALWGSPLSRRLGCRGLSQPTAASAAKQEPGRPPWFLRSRRGDPLRRRESNQMHQQHQQKQQAKGRPGALSTIVVPPRPFERQGNRNSAGNSEPAEEIHLDAPDRGGGPGFLEQTVSCLQKQRPVKRHQNLRRWRKIGAVWRKEGSVHRQGHRRRQAQAQTPRPAAIATQHLPASTRALRLHIKTVRLAQAAARAEGSGQAGGGPEVFFLADRLRREERATGPSAGGEGREELIRGGAGMSLPPSTSSLVKALQRQHARQLAIVAALSAATAFGMVVAAAGRTRQEAAKSFFRVEF